MTQRLIVLDTETTGLEVSQGHRVIEIGCLEIQHRRLSGGKFHHYLNPDRDSDPGALNIHGLTREFLSDKPRFKEIAPALIEFVRDAEVLIHNANFDTGFVNAELAKAGIKQKLDEVCTVTDTWQLAKKKHPGQKNSLDALCQRYQIDNSGRELHGALKDAQLLAEVYLAMTAGQSSLGLDQGGAARNSAADDARLKAAAKNPLVVVRANAEERKAHQEKLEMIAKLAKKEGRPLVWPEGL